jgi:hypothetical protein
MKAAVNVIALGKVDGFCRRPCESAHPRENHTPSGRIIPRFLTFSGGAYLLAAVVALTLLLASANAAPSEEQLAAGVSLEFNKDDSTLYIDLSGPILY